MARRGHRPRPIRIGRADLGLAKIGVARFDVRDSYHLAVALPWPNFVVAMLTAWLALNLIFASLYAIAPGSVMNARANAFSDVFFFSVETLATVGYGVMAPATLYGHIISAIEIVVGMAFTAIVTGLLFVRFSRAKPKIIHSDQAVITTHNGMPTLMLRVANARATIMSGAEARLFALLAERDAEGMFLRRSHELRLEQSHLAMFVMPWTLMHVIDERSPLFGYDGKRLVETGARLFLTLETRNHVLSTTVHVLKDYMAREILFGVRFVGAVRVDADGHAIADLSRLSMVEADDVAPNAL